MRFPKIDSVTIGYSFLLLAWFASWHLFGDESWWLTLVNRAVPFLFIPVVVLLAWVVYSRRFKLMIALLIPILIFAWLYHPYLLPRFANQNNSEQTLNVMTFNVLFSNFDYDAVAKVILTHKPDLVALQEVQPDMMSELEKRLSDEYPYSLMGTQNDYGTTAVLAAIRLLNRPFWICKRIDLLSL